LTEDGKKAGKIVVIYLLLLVFFCFVLNRRVKLPGPGAEAVLKAGLDISKENLALISTNWPVGSHFLFIYFIVLPLPLKSRPARFHS
jgi:hypothetical protein